jgi:hypothetical protein
VFLIDSSYDKAQNKISKIKKVGMQQVTLDTQIVLPYGNQMRPHVLQV